MVLFSQEADQNRYQRSDSIATDLTPFPRVFRYVRCNARLPDPPSIFPSPISNGAWFGGSGDETRVGQGFVSRNASRNMRGCVQGEVLLVPLISCSNEATSTSHRILVPVCLIPVCLIPFHLTKCEKFPFGLKH